ncbi:MAG TPA: hypothetical protein VNG33_12470 [Polyangiaceae bacterium]|nr:hypothetical protein [Polyangiaceae bacterium]
MSSASPSLAAASPSGALPPAVSLGDIGESGPALLLSTSARGAWVALCDGEPRTEKLVLGSGSGEPIDELLAQDPSGRYVVSSRDGVVQLIDAVTLARVNLSELGADVRRARADYAEHRALSFDAGGQYLAYLRKLALGSQIVVRKLDTGSEQSFSPGAGEVFRLQLSPDARWVTFDALRDDTNKNGKLDWPAPEELPRKNHCEKPGLPKFRSFQYQARGDAVTRAVVSLGDGSVRDVPDLVTPLGASLLVREADGSLRLDVAGKRTALSPASCAARVLFADAERGLVLAACAPPPPKTPRKGPAATPSGKREVWLFGPGYAKNLQSELYETSTDRDAAVGTRLVPLYPGSDASLVDLELRVVFPLPSGSRVITTSGALALIWRDNDIYAYDARGKTEQRLAHGTLKNPDLFQAGSSVLLSPFVVVGPSGPVFPSPARALAISVGGFVLTASPPASGGAFPGAIQGPLHWLDASLGAPDGPPR